LLVVTLLLLFAPGAFAAILTPGTFTPAPTDFTGALTVTVPGGGFLTGSVTSAPAGTFAGTYNVGYGVDSLTGHLDFLYQLDVTGSDLKDVSISFFPASVGIIDVGYFTSAASVIGATFSAPSATGCGTGGLAPCTPTEADWLSPPVVGYSFTPTNIVNAGKDSAILVVRTLVDTHNIGVVGWQDSVNFQTPGFDPTPEPAYAGLMLGGLFGLGLLVARRFQARQS